MNDAAGSRTPQEETLTGEIERTREQLGQTVEALAAKADVKGRARRRAAEVRASLRGKARAGMATVAARARELPARRAAAGLREHPAPVAAAVAALVLAWLAVRRPRR
jgi:Protein of unknown function (DUF3618)